MFTILTKPLSGPHRFIYLLKELVKKILGLQTYWPKFVIKSFEKGLKDLGHSSIFNVDPNESQIQETVYVPNGAQTLRYAIWLKKRWIIKRLIAGPNISVPLDKDDIFFHSQIDIIIVPCLWVKNYFESLTGQDNRMKIWAAGSDIPNLSTSKKEYILVYRKQCSDQLYEKVLRELTNRGVVYKSVLYWSFQKADYMDLLDKSYGMIYLQESETQWLALLEAWMKDVPTFVWNRGLWSYKSANWSDEKISAPYLTDEAGCFFLSEEDFGERFEDFIARLHDFSPRDYALREFTNKVTTKKLLDIIH